MHDQESPPVVSRRRSPFSKPELAYLSKLAAAMQYRPYVRAYAPFLDEEVVGVALVLLEERLKDHPIETHLASDLPLVPIDGLLVEQVLINLMENAVKYAPPATPIEISADAGAGSVIVSVADRGPGIPPGEELRIFEKFHRATDDDSAGGVGLGLTICQGIVAAHGGRMWAENREGGGAVFRFTLPIEGAPPELPPEAPLAAEGARG